MVKFSVIIPAFNEEKYITKTLRSLMRQTIEDFEIIVKDGNSRDRTVEVAKKHADKVVSTRDFSAADARNQGARYADGDILVFVDSDTELPTCALERFAQLMRNRDVVGGSCRKVPNGGHFLDRLIYEFVNLSTFFSPYLHVGGAHGNCMFIRRSVFNEVGGFNPKIKIAEEQEFVRSAMRFGKFIFLLDMCVYESPRRIREWGRMKLYLTWLIGTFSSFKVWDNQTYEKVR